MTKYLLPCLLLLCVILVIAMSNASAVSSPSDDHDTLTKTSPLLGAHRCGRHEWPENTVIAAREAARRWPEVMLEIDVQLTADGHVVLMHDFCVERTTSGSGYVGTKTLKELHALDAAYHFTRDDGETFPYRGLGVTVPTLAEVLAAAPNHRFFIEMKDGQGIGRATAQVIQKANAADRCTVASISPLFLEEFHAHAPQVATTYDFLSAADMLNALRGGDWTTYQPPHRMLALSPKLKNRFNITSEEFIRIKEKGILICMFTLNSPEEMQQAIEIGADNILTDRPSLLAALIKKQQED